jgi:alkylation response protein AidB-like acyl-CoA dehydrogenase
MTDPGPADELLSDLLPLRESPEVMALRSAFREWLTANLTGHFEPLRGRGGLWDNELFGLTVEWEQLLARAGWAFIGWPREFGGRAAGAAELFAYRDEYFRAGGPDRVNFLAEDLVGPTIMRHGSDEQKQRFLGPMARCEELWCQGYSEPDAGSDLANIRTRARLENGKWVIDGQKIWTTHAIHADWCFALCRTDPSSKGRQGISYLLIPMHQPGVLVRPIKQMTGSEEFSEVFFDEARTDADNVVGPVGDGWRVAMATLGFERDWFMSRYFRFSRDYARVIGYARASGRLDSSVKADLATSFVQLMAFRAVGLEELESHERGESSILTPMTKLYASTWHQRLGAIAARVLGPAAARLAWPGSAEADLQLLHLYSRAETVFAGTSEIQRNILARSLLKLPSSTHRGTST